MYQLSSGELRKAEPLIKAEACNFELTLCREITLAIRIYEEAMK